MMIPRRDEDMTTETIRLERANNLGGFFGVWKNLILVDFSVFLQSSTWQRPEAQIGCTFRNQESGRSNLQIVSPCFGNANIRQWTVK